MIENKLPFIPAWLDDAGLLPAEFRLYCHLRRCADNSTLIAWPAYKAMTKACGAGKTTIRRCIEELERRGLIAKVGKPFGGSCRYRVLAPIVPPQGQMGLPNSSATGTIETAPIVPPQDCNSPSGGTPIVPPQGQEGKPKKVNSKKVNQIPKASPSEDGVRFAIWFRSLLSVEPKDWKRNFANAYDDLVRLDKRTGQEIRAVCQWGRSDSFWSGNFHSPARLRKRNKDGVTYYDIFREQMSKQHQPEKSGFTSKDIARL